ncbi:MAG: NINE protein [Clostridia bacterium]|nr:NINE protein [Clostridia bacterium]
MKICRICSKPMDDSFTACPYCGAAADGQSTEENTQQNTYQQNFYQQQNPYNAPPFSNGYQQNASYQQPDEKYTPEPRPQRSAYVAAILAFVGGMFGLHNFYLDYKKTAWIQLIVSLVGFVLTFGIASIAMEVWAIIDGIKILKGEINLDGTGAKIKL